MLLHLYHYDDNAPTPRPQSHPQGARVETLITFQCQHQENNYVDGVESVLAAKENTQGQVIFLWVA